jgi:hypothetical protein
MPDNNEICLQKPMDTKAFTSLCQYQCHLSLFFPQNGTPIVPYRGRKAAVISNRSSNSHPRARQGRSYLFTENPLILERSQVTAFALLFLKSFSPETSSSTAIWESFLFESPHPTPSDRPAKHSLQNHHCPLARSASLSGLDRTP